MTDIIQSENRGNCKIVTDHYLATKSKGFSVDRWVILVTGFLQSGEYENGLEMLWRRLRVRCNCKSTVVRSCHFTDNPSALAEWIARTNRDMDVSPEINLIGYSFGGMTCVHLAQELHKRGEIVNRLFLNDAVWRPRFVPAYMLHPFWLMSYLGSCKIRIPENVLNLWTWRQIMNRPRGSKIILDNTEKTQWLQDIILKSPNHQNMDELRHFHEIVSNIVCPISEFRSIPTDPNINPSI